MFRRVPRSSANLKPGDGNVLAWSDDLGQVVELRVSVELSMLFRTVADRLGPPNTGCNCSSTLVDLTVDVVSPIVVKGNIYGDPELDTE